MLNAMPKQNVILEKSFDFSIKMIKLYTFLKDHNEYVISKQLLRSGTSIGANAEEADAGQTHKDFTAKMSIASKEARETRYWLRLLQKSQLVKYDYKEFLDDAEEIIRILTAIVKTSQQEK
jgi:four helix bundle protein